MKRITTLALFLLLIQFTVQSQDIKTDSKPHDLKQDEFNLYQSDKINRLDILQALDFAGIKIHKVDLTPFDKEYSMFMILEEYTENKLIKRDTVFRTKNTYAYYEDDIRHKDYISEIKVVTEQQDNQLNLQVTTNGWAFTKRIRYKTIEDDQFYNLRYYSNSDWESNEKIPLLVFASSWKDKKYGFQRFCGSPQLNDHEEETRAMLQLSPHYFKLSYIILNK